MTVAENALLRRVRDIVAAYSKLPDAIIRAQCKGIGKDPDSIVAADLPMLAERIGNAVGMFTNPQKGEQAASQIRALAPG